MFSLSGITRRHGEGTVEPQHGLREAEGPDDSREVVEKMGALVGPPAVNFTDPMDAASNEGNTLKYNSNST